MNFTKAAAANIVCSAVATVLLVSLASQANSKSAERQGPAETLQATSTEKTETVHYVTLRFTQSSFTLSISQHIKDSANAFSFTFPTTKKFYDSVKEGQEISSKFKTASFLLSGNIGRRKVVVEKKFTKQEKID